MPRGKFYITDPIFYPNAQLHLGHAYTTTLCDVLARFHRLRGDETFFLVGNDDNASKVAKAALAANKSSKQFVDEQASKFQDFYKKLNIQYDDFIQTSDQQKHWPGATKLWTKLVASGDIEKKKYFGLYCVGCESFKNEGDLVNGKCSDHDLVPEKLEEENYFFKLSRYSDQLKNLIQGGNLNVVPESRRNEVLSLINRGLEDVSFSRPAGRVYSWGVPVPGDPSQIMYVWCDALTNYISALGYGSSDESKFQKFWPADLHMVGKDILRFHTIIWPAMLISAGLPPPKCVLAHGFIKSGGRKMSKTLGNVIDPVELINEYGVDALRYYLTREINTFDDGEITPEGFKEAYNAGLANGLGNLVSRIMKMAVSYNVNYEVKEPELPHEVMTHLNNFEIKKAADHIFELVHNLDAFIQKTEPFKKIKVQSEKRKAEEDIKVMVAELHQIAHALSPFLPETASKIKSSIINHQLPPILFPRK